MAVDYFLTKTEKNQNFRREMAVFHCQRYSGCPLTSCRFPSGLGCEGVYSDSKYNNLYCFVKTRTMVEECYMKTRTIAEEKMVQSISYSSSSLSYLLLINLTIISNINTTTTAIIKVVLASSCVTVVSPESMI